MSDIGFEPVVDAEVFRSSCEWVVESPDTSQIAGVFTDSEGMWLYVGSFESGFSRFEIPLAPFFEYQPIEWIDESTIMFVHETALFGLFDLTTESVESFGEFQGQMRVLGRINGVLLGVVDTVGFAPRFTLVGCHPSSGLVDVLWEFDSEDVYYGLSMAVGESNVFVEDYRPDAESIADHIMYKFSIDVIDGEFCIETEIRSLWDDVSASPIGFVNGFLIIRRGGLAEERRFSREETVDEEELFLYDWDSDLILELDIADDQRVSGIVADEYLLVTFRGEGMEPPSLERVGIIFDVENDGSLVEVTRENVTAGSNWCWIEDGLYSYPSDGEGVVCHTYEQNSIVEGEPHVEYSASVIDMFDVSFGGEAASEVNVYKLSSDDEVSGRPVVLCVYPFSLSLPMRDLYAVELLQRGFLLADVSYPDAGYYGRSLVMRDAVEELLSSSYCSSVGLYGFSAGGSQVLNFASSESSELVDCVFAGCPKFEIGTPNTGWTSYLSPARFRDDAPLLFKEYSPLYRAESNDRPTVVLTGEYDTRIYEDTEADFRERVGSNVTVNQYFRGHEAVSYSAKLKMMRDIVELFESELE